MIATRSPRPIPSAIRPLARALTSARNSAFVMSVQAPADGDENAASSGRVRPLRTGRSDKLPATCGVTSAGTVMFFTQSPLKLGHTSKTLVTRARRWNVIMRGWCEHCLLYTSDAADDLTRVDLGGRR